MKVDNYNPWLSIGRGGACLLIIILHTSPFEQISREVHLLFSNVITRWAVPYFFILSGYLYYSNRLRKNKYFKKYITKVIEIYLFWIIIYFPHKMLFVVKHWNEQPLLEWIENTIVDVVYMGFYQHMWFIPALVMAIIFLEGAIIAKEHREYIWKIFSLFAVCLYFLGALAGMYGRSLNLANCLNTVFGTTRNGLFFGIPSVMLGAALAKNENKITSIRKFDLVVLGSLSIVLNIFEVCVCSYYKIVVEYSYGISTILFPLMIMIYLIRVKETELQWININRVAQICDDNSMSFFYLHPLVLIILNDVLNYIGIPSGILLFAGVCIGTGIGVFCLKMILKNTKLSKFV